MIKSSSNGENLNKLKEEDKKVHYTILNMILKGAGIFGLGLIGSAALVAGVGLAQRAVGLLMQYLLLVLLA